MLWLVNCFFALILLYRHCSTFFSFGTVSDTFVLEAKSRVIRDHWATCIRDVINFIHIPVPGERVEEQTAPKKSVLSRRNSRHSDVGYDSDNN